MEEKKTPDKGKLLLKSYAMSLLSLMLCVTMLVGTTYAWFTSDVTTGSNEIQVGTLKVDMVKKNADNTVEPIGGKTNLFGSGTAKWEPGATWFETIQILNHGDLAFDYALYISTVIENPQNVELVGKYIDVYVTTNNADGATLQDILTKWVRLGTLADVVKNNVMLTSGSCTDAGSAEGKVIDEVKIALHMPTTVTGVDANGNNIIMGKNLSGFGLRLNATQKLHETDGFGIGYDQGASTKLLAGTPAELAAAFQAGMDVKLTNNISLDADTTLTVNKGAKMVLDLNGFGISATSNTIGANRELFLVKGNLTVTDTAPATATVATAGAEPAIARGITYQHTGANMEWNAMSTIFDVTAGGVLTLNNVKCENLGGTDMNFVAHLNNWGEASLYANNAYLKAPYCAIRVFNSGYDMNNVVATNSTIESGNRALWVHNYTEVDFGASYDKEVIDARLNINVLNDTNTVIGQVRYGYKNAIVTRPVNNAQELANAMSLGGTVLLRDDIVMDPAAGPVEIPAGNTVVLELDGHKITATHTETTNAVIIGNDGNLTINGEGEIAITYTGTPDNNKAVNAISNRGVLTVNGGKISNVGNGNQIGYAIDCYNGAVLTVNGGEIVASGSSYYDGIRLFCGANETLVTINGGKISSVWAQNPSANKATAVNGTVVVNGGEIATVYYENYTTVKVLPSVATTVTPYGAGSDNTTSAAEGGYTVYSFVH